MPRYNDVTAWYRNKITGDTGFNVKLGSHTVKYLLLVYGAIFFLIVTNRQPNGQLFTLHCPLFAPLRLPAPIHSGPAVVLLTEAGLLISDW